MSERDVEDDHDLLTYGEVRARLQQEVAAQRAVVARLAAEGGTGQANAQAWLAALDGAAERNSRQPINDDNFEQFFGYRGTPRRTT